MHAFGFQVAVSPQEYLEIVIKRPVKASQRHIFHAFLFPDKSGKMLVGTLIGVVCFLYAVYPDPFPELLVMLPERASRVSGFCPIPLTAFLTSSAVMNPRLFLIRS